MWFQINVSLYLAFSSVWIYSFENSQFWKCQINRKSDLNCHLIFRKSIIRDIIGIKSVISDSVYSKKGKFRSSCFKVNVYFASNFFFKWHWRKCPKSLIFELFETKSNFRCKRYRRRFKGHVIYLSLWNTILKRILCLW